MSWAAGCKPKIENKMKRIVLIAIMTMFLPDMNTQAQTASGTKVLVAYFSHSGNTRAMARQIAEATAAIFSRSFRPRPTPPNTEPSWIRPRKRSAAASALR